MLCTVYYSAEDGCSKSAECGYTIFSAIGAPFLAVFISFKYRSAQV